MKMTPRQFLSIALVTVVGVATNPLPMHAAADDGVIDLLFLGHGQREGSGYHLSHVFAPLFNRSLGAEKIRMRYEEDPAVLNPEDLAATDVLLIYANHDTLHPAQEQALLDFVEQGGGFMPIHCASACFGHSDAYVGLVGARFRSHGYEAFTTSVAPGMETHPILDGWQSFATEDETYVHADHHTAGRQVLLYRDDEPWAWVRQQGAGRVFYTAYGHDENTWNQPEFHDLLIRGIRWSAGESKRETNLALVATLPAISYDEADTIPNYRKQTPAPKLARPFSPEESRQLSLAAAGFEMQLFAAEPDIVNPVAFAWDERGRLFVLETVDYPNEIRTGEAGDDRIVICEDTDGDGRADKFTPFAEGFNIPTSLTPIDGGWIVAQAPHFLFIKDTDGDDRADVRFVLNEGWGIQDTHAGPSNLRYGHDNKIWGAVGYSNVSNSTQGRFAQGVFRMDPDSGSVEPVGLFSNNTWGLGISEDFEIFGSTANNAPAFHVPLWRRHTYERHPSIPSRMAAKIDDFTQFFAATDKFLQVDAHGRYTAGSGFNIYTARAFPRRYWNQAAFIGGPTGHLLGQFFLQEEGASYVAQNRGSLVSSIDEWLSPVFTDVGPDGQLWMADWYNFIIQHNPRPSKASAGFDTTMGQGNAHVNPLRDRQHGRIYRLVAKDAPAAEKVDLTDASTAKLITTLANDNLFWRLTAQRKLVRETRREAIPALREIVLTDRGVDELGLNPRVIHAIWSLHGLGAFQAASAPSVAVAQSALTHPSAAVRKNAVMALTDGGGEAALQLAAGLIEDEDAKTRLKSVIALGLLPPSVETAEVLYAHRHTMPSDPWISRAFAYAVLANESNYREQLLADTDPNQPSVIPLYASVEEVPDYIVIKRHLESFDGNWISHLTDWESLPDATLDLIGLALLDVWKIKLHEPTGDEVAVIQQIADRMDAAGQMRFKLRSPGLPLKFGKVELSAYAEYAAEHTFEPEIWGWGSRGEGQRLYAQHCVSCHGADAHGDASLEAPALAGMDAWYTQVQLQKFHRGIRGVHFKNPRGIAMNGALAFLDQEAEPIRLISYLAHYLEAEPEHVPEVTIEGDIVKGETHYALCATCHGPEGQGNRELNAPKLTGKQDWYLLKHLAAFRDGVRGSDPRDVPGGQMAAIAKTLPDEQGMRDLVSYIHTLNTK